MTATILHDPRFDERRDKNKARKVREITADDIWHALIEGADDCPRFRDDDLGSAA